MSGVSPGAGRLPLPLAVAGLCILVLVVFLEVRNHGLVNLEGEDSVSRSGNEGS